MCAAVHFPVELLTDNAFFSSLLHPSQVSPAGGLSIIRCHGGKGQREHLQRFCRDGFLSAQMGNPRPDQGRAEWSLPTVGGQQPR